jgi:hypothetical protein
MPGWKIFRLGQRMSHPSCWDAGVKTKNPSNPDHHLWNNNGTYWCHYTVHEAGHTKRRVRVSLHTKNGEEARARRDAVLRSVPNASIRFMPRMLPDVALWRVGTPCSFGVNL